MENSTLPCTQKLTFDSQKEAKSAATTLAWQRGVRLKVYKCHHCRLWHLSSQPDDE